MVEIHVLAQRGEVVPLHNALRSGIVRAMDRDDQGVTALHWAAINSQLECCRLLLDYGADVNAPGGELQATPLQWCARNGDLRVLQFLLERGGNPLTRDAQGFNVLHLITHSSTVMPLVYILQRPEFSGSGIDLCDPEGHTALMWAAYQGDAISVAVLLRHGASVDVSDKAQLTPLHWAAVYGDKLCIRRIIEAGAPLDARDKNNQTPEDMALALDTIDAYEGALNELGRGKDGRLTRGIVPRGLRNPLIYLTHIAGFGTTYYCLARLPWYLVLPVALFALGAMHVGIAVLCTQSWGRHALQMSHYFQSVVAMTIFWPTALWLGVLMPAMPDLWMRHIVTAIFDLLTALMLFSAGHTDPGFCPRPATTEARRAEIIAMAEAGDLNGMKYCVMCMARRPMRARHCNLCGRCVARGDHHCPWITNCVGMGNHRMFLTAIPVALTAISLYFSFVYTYFQRTLAHAAPVQSCVLPKVFCAAVREHGFMVYCTVWSIFMYTFLALLFCVQIKLVSRQLTSYESHNLRKHGFMASTMNHKTQSGLAHRLAEIQPEQKQHQHYGFGRFLLALVGGGIAGGRHAREEKRASEPRNPFDRGIAKNLYDFFSGGTVLRLDYKHLYDLPH